MIVAADEELGAHMGAKWLCEEHPEKVRADFVVNEGGGALFEIDGRRFYGVSLGEKGVFRFMLRARGRAGHGSVPSLGDNALLRLAPAISRLVEQPPLQPTAAGLEFLASTTGREVDIDNPGDLVTPRSPSSQGGAAGRRLHGRADAPGNLAPTQIQGFRGRQRDPCGRRGGGGLPRPAGPRRGARARADLGRPGRLDPKIEIEFQDRTVGNESPYESELADAIREWLAEVDPEAMLVPT